MLQRRKPDELPAGDEDGPMSEVEEDKEDTDDEDPTSEEGEGPVDDAVDRSSLPLAAFRRGAEHAERDGGGA